MLDATISWYVLFSKTPFHVIIMQLLVKVYFVVPYCLMLLLVALKLSVRKHLSELSVKTVYFMRKCEFHMLEFDYFLFPSILIWMSVLISLCFCEGFLLLKKECEYMILLIYIQIIAGRWVTQVNFAFNLLVHVSFHSGISQPCYVFLSHFKFCSNSFSCIIPLKLKRFSYETKYVPFRNLKCDAIMKFPFSKQLRWYYNSTV